MQNSIENKESPVVSVITPLHNEEAVIELFYQRVRKALNQSCDYEIIFVDDGSTDNTGKKLEKLRRRDQRVKIVSLTKNTGQAAAIFAGLKMARGKAIAVIDGDLQDPPELIPKMIRAWKRGNKVVMARRVSRQDSMFKIVTAKAFYFLLNGLTKLKFSGDFGEFYLFDRSLLPRLLRFQRRSPMLRFVLPNLNLPFTTIPYTRSGRKRGKSGYPVSKMVKLAFQSIGFVKHLGELDDPKKVAIIGGGIGGLALGYYLSKKNFQITIYEKEKTLGGLLQTIDLQSTPIDKYYHHFFRSDKHLLDLLDELKLNCKIKWHQSHLSYLKNGQFYDFDTPKDLFRLSFLSLWAKFRFGAGYILIKFLPYHMIPRNLSATWLIKFFFGAEVLTQIWQPLLQGKFQTFADTISGLWFAARIKSRSSSQGKKGEELGYLNGGFRQLIDSLANKITRTGGRIMTNFSVAQIQTENNQFVVDNEKYDFVISTVPGLLQKSTVKYLGVICAMLTLKKRLTPYYWTNVLDKTLPFKVIVEQTNLVPSRRYGGDRIVYLGEYLPTYSSKYILSDAKVKKLYLDALTKIFPDIRDNLKDFVIFRSPWAQPIIPTNFEPLKFEAGLKNQYELTMAHIYPQDRGVNYAIRAAKFLADEITR